MACGLLSASAMPIDTLLPLGTSPPMPSLFLSHRYTATSFMYINDKSALAKVGSTGGRKELRPCLRDGRQKAQSECGTKDICQRDGGTMVDLDPNGCPYSSLAKYDVRRPGCRQKTKSSERSTKRVCFADSKGLALESVRVMDGPSCMPPRLKSQTLKDIIQDEKAEPFHQYTYVAAFEQPAANYLDLRNKLEKDLVSLENVLIKDNTTVMGTIKVKNVAFEKSVVVRVTFTKWSSFQDIPATFVQKGSSGHADRYDCFSFSFDIPPNMKGEAFEFCIQYTCDGRTFWDSRNGENYRIISQHEKSMTEQQKMALYCSLSSQGNWGDFSYWKVEADERPYW